MKKNMMISLSMFLLLYHVQNIGMEPQSNVLSAEMKDFTKKDLFRAIRCNNSVMLEAMLEEKPLMKTVQGTIKGQNRLVSPLHAASFYNAKACMNVLLKKGVNPKASIISGDTPLHYVKSVKGAKLLLEYDVDLDQKNRAGVTPFAFLMYQELVEVGQVLLHYKADINKRDKGKNSPLHTAIERGQLKVVEFLLRNNADPNKRNSVGETPFDSAIKSSNKEILTLFEKYGMVFFPGMSYEALLQNPYDWDVAVASQWNCLARLFGNVKNLYGSKGMPTSHGLMVNEYGCVANRVSYKGLEALYGKSQVVSIDKTFIEFCKKASAYVNSNASQELDAYIQTYPFVISYDDDQARIMMKKAINSVDTRCLELLLKHKIDCHKVLDDKYDGGNFLHYAVVSNNPEAIKLLMQYGVDCTWCDRNNRTPIELANVLIMPDCLAKLNELMGEQFVEALYRQQYKRCKQLFACITDYNVRLEAGQTLAHKIVFHTPKYINKFIMLLMGKGADFNVYNNSRHTPLWQVISIGAVKFHKEICEILLNAGAQVDMYDKNGRSPLDIMVFRKDFELVKLFLRYGAIVTLKMLEDEWQGTDILQQAYNKQQEEKQDEQRIIDACNKELAATCLICFEKPNKINKIRCTSFNGHEGNGLCDGCYQQLYDQEKPCPICREKLL